MDFDLSRRAALRVLGGVGALSVFGACSSSDDSSPSSPKVTGSGTTTSGGSPVVVPGAPPALERNVRDLRLRLWAEATTAEIFPGLRSPVWSYGAEVLDGDPASVVDGDSYLGPTLHLRQGQRVRVRFENRLPQHSIVHWHGLVVPQGQDGQPPEAVAPGKTYDYDFVVANPPGTYWYHPHPHGHTGEQVYRGLAGMLIVHGEEPALPAGANDVPIVLQDRTVNPDGTLVYARQHMDQMMGFVGTTLVTNGVAGCRIAVRREPYRLRVLNGANSRTQQLTWSTGAPFHVLATDGHLLPAAVRTPQLVLTPAQRSDVWVDFSGLAAGTTVQLLAADLFVESGSMMGGGMGGMGGMGGSGAPGGLVIDPQVSVTFVVVESDARPATAPSVLGAAPSVSAAAAVNAAAPKQFVLSTRQAAHWINDRQWAERNVTDVETVGANTTELWEFVNRSPMPHPMHIHGSALRVVARSWEDDALASTWVGIEPGVIETGLRDTVLVWPGQRVRLAVPFAEHEGYFLYHCHVLEHEDAGMMRSFRAVRRGA